jgi:hypothetical protein
MISTTVYYHNRCGVIRELTIRRHGFCDDAIEIYVEGGQKGKKVIRCGDVIDVWGEGE